MDRDNVLSLLQTSMDGLSEDEAKRRVSLYGYNEISEEKKPSPFAVFAKQFKEPLIAILLAATAISALLGEVVDAVIIMVIVVLAAVVGFVQEFRSEKAIAALKKMAAVSCRVIRGGEERTVDVRELVPGDIIIVSSGDRISADSYLLESFNLQVDEAPLTGESMPVSKTPCILPVDTPVADRKNILYTLTAATYGHGRAVVFATGMNTQLGKIAGMVQTIELQKTPFEIRMRQTGKILSVIMLAVVAIISVVGFFRGHQIIEMLVWAISLAVAAVPEALPAVIATSLTLGVYRMAKQNAIVRRLPAVESLGCTTVICSDKTGTLTRGEMTVRKIYIYDHLSEVTGSGYLPDGKIVSADGPLNKDDLEILAKCALLCNDASVKIENGKATVVGDPTEAALAVLAVKAGLDRKQANSQFPRVHEIPFSSERKMMTTVHQTNGVYQAFAKGAVEVVLDRCKALRSGGGLLDMDLDKKSRIIQVNNEMARAGLRVLALAYKDLEGNSFSELENDLVFVGLAAMMDPPRPETIDAVAQCKSAGIDVVMITGDHSLTAASVAKEIGIADEGHVMTGTDLERMDEKELAEQVQKVKVYSRVSPEHKLKIVRSLKSKDNVVAMTGDGTNDAPALKAADIGIAMGITGTQVAKESSAMVLADDNFATIVGAVEEGRRIFDNVKKYLVYLLSANISEILVLTFSVMMGWPFPLLAKHLLYINLATDGSPAIALGLEPREPDVMKRKPRRLKEGVFSGVTWLIIGISIILSVTTLSLFWAVLESEGWQSEAALSKARTMVFGMFVFFELFFALSCRSLRHNLPRLGLFTNKALLYSLIGESSAVLFIMNHPLLQGMFDLAPLGTFDWVLMIALSTTGFIFTEVAKLVIRRKA
jgi:Ca2+-transporting ATPase